MDVLKVKMKYKLYSLQIITKHALTHIHKHTSPVISTKDTYTEDVSVKQQGVKPPMNGPNISAVTIVFRFSYSERFVSRLCLSRWYVLRIRELDAADLSTPNDGLLVHLVLLLGEYQVPF